MRELGDLGMSIGTSLAFESQEGQFNLATTDNLYINLRTLVRNAIGAYDKDDLDRYKVDPVVEAVVSDLKAMGSAMKDIAKMKAVNLVIYYPSYNGLKSKFPKADLWEPTKEKQKAYQSLMEKVVKEIKAKFPNVIKDIDYRIPDFSGKCTVITHHAVDLTTTEGYQRLSLLETHSGIVKPYILWNTKLTGGPELYNIPLNTFTIQIFGDRSTNFKSSSKAIKDLVKNLADVGKWTTASTMSRIRSTVLTHTTGVTQAGLLLLLK